MPNTVIGEGAARKVGNVAGNDTNHAPRRAFAHGQRIVSGGDQGDSVLPLLRSRDADVAKESFHTVFVFPV